jgi:hypothetical protein
MTIIELKAQIYDYLAQLEYIQKKIQEANKELQELIEKQPVQELQIVKD